MRALFMDFPDDPNVSDLGDEYMFGPAFLVAPRDRQGVTAGRFICLPVQTGTTTGRMSGSRAGRRLPSMRRSTSCHCLCARIDCAFGRSDREHQRGAKIAKVRVYPGSDADFTLFDDDGNTYAYEKGNDKVTQLHWDDASGKLSHAGTAAWEGADSGMVEIVGR